MSTGLSAPNEQVQEMLEPTVLIVGAGTFGTSAAYHLAKTYNDPSRVTVVDRWDPSSHEPKTAAAIDINRIIRTDYVNPLYCNLANEAIHPWFWDVDLGHFFHKSGWVVLDEKGNDFSRNVRRTFQQRGSDYTKDVDVQSLGKRWEALDGIQTKDLGDAYFNPEAGWCDAASATARFMSVAERKGVKRVTAEIKELEFDRSQRRVVGLRTADGQILKADKIVLASGAWTSKLLTPIEDALRLAEEHQIERQIRAVGRLSAYYTLSPHETSRMCEADVPILVYGDRGILTPPSQENRTLKINDLRTEFVNTVNTASGRAISVPSTRNQHDVPEKLKLEMEELLRAMIPAIASTRKPDRWRVCWDAVSPTGDWLLCRHPHSQLENLHIAIGGNFSSYKFMPIAGKYISNVLQGKSNGPEKDEAWGWKSEEHLTLGNSLKKELGSRCLSGTLSEFRSFEELTREAKL